MRVAVILIAVGLLLSGVGSEAAPVAEAGVPPPLGESPAKSVKITSDRTDFDRKEGVIMFDRNVFVDDAEYQMHADQLYVFLDTNGLGRVDRKAGGAVREGADGTDRSVRASRTPGDKASADLLKRIVALGNVSITNETRVGTCAKAVYAKASSKITMYGDADKGIVAKLVDNGKRKSEVEGKKITFWIDTEQVEVEGSTVTLEGGLGGKEGAKKLLGK